MAFVLADAVLYKMTSVDDFPTIRRERDLPGSWYTTICGRRLTLEGDEIKLQFS